VRLRGKEPEDHGVTVTPRVVIVGGGFGGLFAARELRKEPVQITLVDRTNHHLFQPLLYQVASAGLSPADIASPIRSILSKQQNVQVLLATVRSVDLDRRVVHLEDGELAYDCLILAAGACTSYFGHPEWEGDAPGLKSLQDAIEVRKRPGLASCRRSIRSSPSARSNSSKSSACSCARARESHRSTSAASRS